MTDFIKDYIDIEKVGGYCKRCENYGKKWSCPPHEFNVVNFWNSYNEIEIIASQIIFDKKAIEEIPMDSKVIKDILKAEKQKLAQELWLAEKNVKNSLGLFPGSCHLCESCSKKENKPCLYPTLTRHSLESLGCEVGKTSENLLKTSLVWAKDGKLPDYYILISAILYT